MTQNKGYKVLVIGGGILEHSLVWKLAQSPQISKLYCAPGNAGISEIAECVEIIETDYFQLIKFAKEEKIDLTIVGPYRLIADGITDHFYNENLRIFAPRTKQAEIGASRVIAKEMMRHYSIPTPPYHIFENIDGALSYCEHSQFPVVIKIDGTALAGTAVCHSMDDVANHLDLAMKQKIFGEAGERVIIENFIPGKMISTTILMDRNTIIPFPTCQIVREFTDSERIPLKYGAYYPANCVKRRMLHNIEREILVPLVHAINRQYHSYKGFLTVDMVITEKGPRVLDFKIQWSDILAQVLLSMFKSDFFDLINCTLDGCLEKAKINWETAPVMGLVVMKNVDCDGYVELPAIPSNENSEIHMFCGKTKKLKQKVWATSERVLGITATGPTLKDAYDNITHKLSQMNLGKNLQFQLENYF